MNKLLSLAFALSLVTVAACSSGTVGSTSGSGSDASPVTSPTCDAEGSWDVQFQWSGRTPGELTIVVAADKTAQIPAGPGVSATTGTTSVTGNEITWSFADGSTFSGTATSSCSSISAGTMKNTAGTPGKFSAAKGTAPAAGGACTGCTADADCGDCERCERTTCTCVSKLTCP